MSQQAIKDFVRERKIPVLLHFTRLSHLPAILKYGLLSRQGFEHITMIPGINDEPGLYYHQNRVALSIAHPDSPTFHKCRRDIGGEWCVIGIGPELLWQKDCLFYKHKANDKRVSAAPASSFAGIDALQAMFDESQRDASLKSFDPTDEQAEVLVLDSIPKENFVGIVFPTLKLKMEYKDRIAGISAMYHAPDKGYFLPRLMKRLTEY